MATKLRFIVKDGGQTIAFNNYLTLREDGIFLDILQFLNFLRIELLRFKIFEGVDQIKVGSVKTCMDNPVKIGICITVN